MSAQLTHFSFLTDLRCFRRSSPQRFWLWLMFSWLLIVVCSVGCDQPDDQTPINPATSLPAVPLTIGIIGDIDETLGPMIARQWSAQRDGELTILNWSEQNFSDSQFSTEDMDLIIYPPGMVGELVSRDQLARIPNTVWKSETLNRQEILRHHRTRTARHGNEVWAIPLGSPQWVMLFRRSNVQTNRIPDQWNELIESSLELPLAEGWAAEVFLARVAPMIRQRGKLSALFDRKTMRPLIDQEPFVQALQDLKTLTAAIPKLLDYSPADIYRRILSGKSSIGMTWPHSRFLNNQTDAQYDTEEANIIITAVPGSKQWFDFQDGRWNNRQPTDEKHVPFLGKTGWVASVSRSNRDAKSAYEFIEWLSSKSVNLKTVANSHQSGPFRASHLGDPQRWTGPEIPESAAEQYADVIRETHELSTVLIFPRIPGQAEYRQVLDQAIRECLSSNSSPQQVLDQAVDQWESITESLDRDQQIRALRTASGLSAR